MMVFLAFFNLLLCSIVRNFDIRRMVVVVGCWMVVVVVIGCWMVLVVYLMVVQVVVFNIVGLMVV
jgi:hypothetical protein